MDKTVPTSICQNFEIDSVGAVGALDCQYAAYIKCHVTDYRIKLIIDSKAQRISRSRHASAKRALVIVNRCRVTTSTVSSVYLSGERKMSRE